MSEKRIVESSDESDDDVVGPSLARARVPKKLKHNPKPKVESHWDAFQKSYTSSYQQESPITALAKSTNDQLVMVGLRNGTVKFWQRVQPKTADPSDNDNDINDTLECIKQFSAHPGREIRQLLVMGTRLATVAQDDPTIRIFDLVSLDMVQVVDLGFVPNTIGPASNCWYQHEHHERLLVGHRDDATAISAVDPDDPDAAVVLKSPHRNPIQCVVYNTKHQCFVSADTRGVLEYWLPHAPGHPASVKFEYKSQTGLLEIVKARAHVLSMASYQDRFVTFSSDGLVRDYNFCTGTIVATTRVDAGETAVVEGNTIIIVGNGITVWESGHQVCTLATVDAKAFAVTFTNAVLLVKHDISDVDATMIAAHNAAIESRLVARPLMVATAKGADRLFVYGKSTAGATDFDYRGPRNSAKNSAKNGTKASRAAKVTLHTTAGDICIKVFGDLVPKTTENFIGLCRKKYYDNVVFHRVIKNFMIQTGDPLGNGTGGESLWGGHFNDEFSPLLTHAKPFMVSMANAGPNTNGSQFFITTETASFLDRKHTVFGEVTEGFDTVRAIESAQTDDDDRPLDQIVILSTSVE